MCWECVVIFASTGTGAVYGYGSSQLGADYVVSLLHKYPKVVKNASEYVKDHIFQLWGKI